MKTHTRSMLWIGALLGTLGGSGTGRAQPFPWGIPPATPGQASTIEVVRTAFAPLLVVPLGRSAGGREGPRAEAFLGGPSPAAFGLASGRLQVVAPVPSRGLLVVEIGGPAQSALFTLSVADGVGGRPVRIADEARADLDTALDADARRLAYVGPRGLTVACVAATEAEVRPTVVVVPRPTDPGERLERPRFLGADWLVYERSRTPSGGAIASVIEMVRADGTGAPRVLLAPAGHAQDRTPVVFDPDRLLVYRNGVLHFADHGKLTALAPHFEGYVATGEALYQMAPRAGEAPVLVLLGAGGTEAPRALASIDEKGTLRRLTDKRPLYLDPIVAPDGHGVAVSMTLAPGSKDARGTARWAVQEVGWNGEVRVLTPPEVTPIQLVTWDASGRWLAGCRGHEVVVIDAAHAGPARVVASDRGEPSCTVKAIADSADGPVVVFEQRDRGDTRSALVPVSGGPARLLLVHTHVVAVLGGGVVVSSWDPSARIVARSERADGRVSEVVPWQREGIPEAYLTADSAGTPVVVYRHGTDARWWALPALAAGPRVPVAVTAGIGVERGAAGEALAQGELLGFVRGWMVFRRGERCLGVRLDGRDARRPVVLAEGAQQAVVAAGAGRLVVRRAEGAEVAIVAIPIGADGAGARAIVLHAPVGRFDVDEDAGVVVALRSAGVASPFPATMLAVAALDGHDADKPRLVPVPDTGPRQPELYPFEHGGPIDVVAVGGGLARVSIRGPDMHMNSLPPVFVVPVRLDGKRVPPSLAERKMDMNGGDLRPCGRVRGTFAPCAGGGVEPDPYGAETPQLLGRIDGW